MASKTTSTAPTIGTTDPVVIYDILHEARNRLGGRYVQLHGITDETAPAVVSFIGALDDRLEAIDINDVPAQLALIEDLDRELRELA